MLGQAIIELLGKAGIFPRFLIVDPVREGSGDADNLVSAQGRLCILSELRFLLDLRFRLLCRVMLRDWRIFRGQDRGMRRRYPGRSCLRHPGAPFGGRVRSQMAAQVLLDPVLLPGVERFDLVDLFKQQIIKLVPVLILLGIP